ncbi:hypothetical protein PILCRDRAFT_823513 [Piloderma croceum F 1598]|uniref:Uncharacterized protein n=1 Tax=Piloderma croceum (strain F 1598) TaxID=765440 RepID=A0A0C3F3C6_PILCF|nr:hypothetical protein PILCRDRAFT_823513 [Piloderma croceum F 1598]
MSTSTRKRTNEAPSFGDNTNITNPADLPSSRPRKKALRRVSPPLSSLSLNKLIYILVLFAVLLTAFYSYRIVQYKSQVGGWWNLALGKRPPQLRDDGGDLNFNSNQASKPGGKKWQSGESDVEDRINALAEALGMPSKELASAIAGAVKQFVPPASLSSVSAAASKETGRNSEALKILLGGGVAEKGDDEKKGEGMVGEVVSGLGSVVGMDEPPEA